MTDTPNDIETLQTKDSMNIKGLVTETKARLTGKRYGSNDIIILGQGYEEAEQHRDIPFAIQEQLESLPEIRYSDYKEPTREESYERAIAQGHPRNWKEPYRGCGFGYGQAVNHYYAALKFDRNRKIKKMLPLIAGVALVGGAAGLILKKASCK